MQIMLKFQIQNYKLQTNYNYQNIKFKTFCILDIRILNLFGICNFEFVIYYSDFIPNSQC